MHIHDLRFARWLKALALSLEGLWNGLEALVDRDTLKCEDAVVFPPPPNVAVAESYAAAGCDDGGN